MNNLIENYKIILNNLKNTCGDIESFHQIRTPKLCTLELVALNLTAEYQIDLFTYSNINLSIPMTKNQYDFVQFSKTKAKIRKRIENQFLSITPTIFMESKHTKSFLGLVTRLLLKITAFTMIQYLNVFVFKIYKQVNFSKNSSQIICF